MTATLADRGPDGEGHWSNDWVRFGHRRLSIIDLSDAGSQPMSDPARRLTVVFNGCIYNHVELRAQLGSSWAFRSHSDTEVILAAYARWGEDFVDHLVGMFSIVIVDDARQLVVFARDRLGIKPLYFARISRGLRFGSTLPSLLAGGDVDTSLDPIGLHHYVSWHSIVPAPHTVLRGVQKLPAATIAVVDREGHWREREYWRPRYERDDARRSWDYEQWCEALHQAITVSVQRRLTADVPVGVLLSGGVDSSLLVGILAELGHEEVPTFSIGFDAVGEQPGDEFAYSDIVASAFSTDHHRLRFDSEQLARGVEATVGAMTEPMATQDVAAFYLLSQAVSQHVKVVLAGQGADEVFAGYRYHQPAAATAREQIASVFNSAFRDLAHSRLAEYLEPERIMGDDVSSELIAAHLAQDGAETALDAVLRLDTHVLMPDDPVKRVDSMTMAWGLEGRVPFLDHELVELAAACPPEYKTRQGGKGILKDVARRVIPPAVIDRPKGYFPVPALIRLEGAPLALARDALTAPEARDRHLFRPGAIDALLARPNERFTQVGGNLLWSLATLELWLQHHNVR